LKQSPSLKKSLARIAYRIAKEPYKMKMIQLFDVDFGLIELLFEFFTGCIELDFE
jgi:hypothetical protein